MTEFTQSMYTTKGKEMSEYIHNTDVSHGTNTNIKILSMFYIYKYMRFQVPLALHCTKSATEQCHCLQCLDVPARMSKLQSAQKLPHKFWVLRTSKIKGTVHMLHH